jgi:cytochrome c556
MKSLSTKLLGALVVPFLVISCGQGSGGGQAEVDDSPEATAFRYRQAVMRAIAYKTGQLRGMAQGEIPANDEAFKKHSRDLAVLGSMIPEGFIPNSGDVEGTAALPEVWTNMADFEMKAEQFTAGAQALADAAERGGMAAAQGMVQGVGQSCGDCHRPYRRRNE